MAVGIDDRLHGLARAVRVVEIQGGGRVFGGNQRIHHDQACIAFNDGHVGKIGIAHLVNAFRDFVQAVAQHQLRLPPQAGMHRVRRGCGHDPGGRHVPAHGRGQECVFPEIPGFTAAFVQNAAVVRQGGHKAALGVVVVLPVVEIQIPDSGFVGRAGGGRGRFAGRFRGGVHHGSRICRMHSQTADNAAGQARRAEKEVTEHPHDSS